MEKQILGPFHAVLPGTTPVFLLILWWPLPWTQVPWLSFQGHCVRFCLSAALREPGSSLVLKQRYWSNAWSAGKAVKYSSEYKVDTKSQGRKYSWEILWRLETSLDNYSVVQVFCLYSVNILFFFLLIYELDRLMVLLFHAHPPPHPFPSVSNAEMVLSQSLLPWSLFSCSSQPFSLLFCLFPELTVRKDLETGSFLPLDTFPESFN